VEARCERSLKGLEFRGIFQLGMSYPLSFLAQNICENSKRVAPRALQLKKTVEKGEFRADVPALLSPSPTEREVASLKGLQARFTPVKMFGSR
jgi:hypothetical protein